MSEEVILFVLFITFMVIVFLGWFIYLRTKNKERMALIERDKDVSEFYSHKKSSFSFPWLKIGVIATGFSIGWIIALVIAEVGLRKYDGSYFIQPEPQVLGILFLFTSVSILVAYFVDKPKNKE
jgi:cbb3-type cytochrome oxidase subunit 3